MTEIIDDQKPKNSIAKEQGELKLDAKPQDQGGKPQDQEDKARKVRFSPDVKVKEYDPAKPGIRKETEIEKMKGFEDNPEKKSDIIKPAEPGIEKEVVSKDNPEKKPWIIKTGQNGQPIVFIKKGAEVDDDEINNALGEKKFTAVFKKVDELPQNDQPQDLLAKKPAPEIPLAKDVLDGLGKLIQKLKEKGISLVKTEEGISFGKNKDTNKTLVDKVLAQRDKENGKVQGNVKGR